MSNIVVVVMLVGDNLEPYGYMYTRTGVFKPNTQLNSSIPAARNNFAFKDYFCSTVEEIEMHDRN